MSRFEWFGAKVARRTEEASRIAMDQTMMACVAGAKRRVPVKTSLLQGSIEMRPTTMTAGELLGLWGSFSVNYAIYVELDTKAHIIRPKNAKALYWPGAAHPVKVVHHPGTQEKPYLRPTADEEYPKLAGRIRRVRQSLI